MKLRLRSPRRAACHAPRVALRPRSRDSLPATCDLATIHGQARPSFATPTRACTRSPSRSPQVDARIRRLVDDMLETMYAADGVGLAATQVDVHERVIVIDTSDARDEPLVLINPEIVGAQRRDGVRRRRLPVGARRSTTRCSATPAVTVRALDRDGRVARVRGRGPARGVRPARDGSPAGQGVRRVPEPAQAQPHQDARC